MYKGKTDKKVNLSSILALSQGTAPGLQVLVQRESEKVLRPHYLSENQTTVYSSIKSSLSRVAISRYFPVLDDFTRKITLKSLKFI